MRVLLLWIIFTFLHIGLTAQIPMEGLQGFWPFNGNADEFFENKNNGVVNGATLTLDRCGNPSCAYNFDGINDFIQCTTDSMDIVNEVSISLWIKKRQLGVGTDIAVSKFSVFNFDSGYNIQFDANGAAEIRGRDGNDFFSDSNNNGVSLLDDEWHHLVGIVDKSTWKIYVDNILVGSFDNGHTTVNVGGSYNNLRFGRRSSNSVTLPPQYYDGEIDDIFIYNRAITLAEIQTLYEIDCTVIKESVVEYAGCVNDGFEVEVNNVTYNQENPVGIELISLGLCADSMIQVNLSFQDVFRDTVSYSGCEGDGFEVLVGATLYNEFLPQGEEIIMSQSGCDTMIQVNLSFQGLITDTISYAGCEGDGFEVLVGATLYDEFMPQGEEILISQNGCDSIITIDLFFEDETICFENFDIKLPNIFTPGGPDNSIFRIRAPDNVEIIDLIIFDRWGNKVYENDNAEQEWDGTIGGNPAPSDVYIYTVTYIIPGRNPITESSDLTLLR